MSIRVMTKVWETSQQKGSALLLLLAIADFADDAGQNAFPSIETLATKVRMTQRNVQLLLRKLGACGELDCEVNAGRNGSNRYRVITDPDEIARLKATFRETWDAETAARMESHTGGENFAPPSGGGEAGFRGENFSGRNPVREGAQPAAPLGVKPVAPNPSLNHQEPSSINERANERGAEESGKAEGGRPKADTDDATPADPQPAPSPAHPVTASPPHRFEAWSRDEARLPQIPLDVWTCEERKLLPLLTAWRDEHGLCQWLPVAERTALLGAVLAARHAQRSDPERYARACLRRGVQPGWIAAACKLNEKYRRTASYAPG